MDGNCILCGKRLKDGTPTNREHYVPATLIRNFKRVRIPERFSHALRVDLRPDESGEILLVSINNHKRWATVVTHTKCNSDASHMCQDMKYIIDNPHNYPAHKESSIVEYYAHIWNTPGNEITKMAFENVSNEEVDEMYKGVDSALIYTPGSFWVGKIFAAAMEDKTSQRNDYEKHTIYLGTKAGLEKIVNQYKHNPNMEIEIE